MSHWVYFVLVPKIDRGSLSTGDEFEFRLPLLRHTKQGTIHSLMTADSLFDLQVISADSPIHGARVDNVRSVNIWEQAHDVLLLVIELDQQFSINSCPDSHSTISSSRENVVAVSIERCNWPPMS